MCEALAASFLRHLGLPKNSVVPQKAEGGGLGAGAAFGVRVEVGLCVEDGTITTCEVYSDALYPDLIQAFSDALSGGWSPTLESLTSDWGEGRGLLE
ncbi:lipoate-protein ligase [Cyclospora cayetanensis]|uniref:lipoate--protein ligase n=1 Tax=Cyclospora cayetanensis TaxID=88456 RepID=A0A1D3D2M8_9EIME|nr:lipoate-protein ligase [Cyclospora cayetanensis]